MYSSVSKLNLSKGLLIKNEIQEIFSYSNNHNKIRFLSTFNTIHRHNALHFQTLLSIAYDCSMLSNVLMICVLILLCYIYPDSYKMGTGGFFPGGEAQPGHDADHSPPSSAEVKKEYELYVLSTKRTSMECNGTTLPF
jgi:hypothetical protein